MHRILLLTALLASPAFAGGPVITEEPPIADVRPQGDGGKWVVPVIVGAVILGAIASGSDNCNGPEAPGGGKC
ncbi:MAG TPA: hypothetical protein PK225_03655 [Azonexus sp.]|nr:hypothetical protein [Azonexus sp.]